MRGARGDPSPLGEFFSTILLSRRSSDVKREEVVTRKGVWRDSTMSSSPPVSSPPVFRILNHKQLTRPEQMRQFLLLVKE